MTRPKRLSYWEKVASAKRRSWYMVCGLLARCTRSHVLSFMIMLWCVVGAPCSQAGAGQRLASVLYRLALYVGRTRSLEVGPKPPIKWIVKHHSRILNSPSNDRCLIGLWSTRPMYVEGIGSASERVSTSTPHCYIIKRPHSYVRRKGSRRSV